MSSLLRPFDPDDDARLTFAKCTALAVIQRYAVTNDPEKMKDPASRPCFLLDIAAQGWGRLTLASDGEVWGLVLHVNDPRGGYRMHLTRAQEYASLHLGQRDKRRIERAIAKYAGQAALI